MREIDSLLKRAKRYLESSDLLIRSGDFDSSASRTYYAMFYTVQAGLLKKGLSFSSHKAVISGFGEHFVKSGILPKELGRELNRAFEKRQLSDYEFDFVISEKEAKDMLANGQRFVDQVSAFLKNSQ